MERLSKNILYNTVLTVSGYLFPLITYPYITRTLGPEGLGAANFGLSVVDYAILFSSLGISAIGIKEIAKCGDDKKLLSKNFSKLVSLHIVLTGSIALIYWIAVFSVPALRSDLRLYLIGFCKLACNVFLVEWLYTGMQNFRYITIRTLLTKILYVILIFLLIRNQTDYWLYVAITVFQLILNALINWKYSRNYVRYRFVFAGIRQYFKPVLMLGMNKILFSFYGSFIILYLGFVCSTESVGYFSTSTKMYAIILSFISAFNGVLMPYMNSLYGQGNTGQMKVAIEKSINLVLCLSIPLAICFFASAHDIVPLFAGAAYERSVLPFQIIIIQVVLVGVSQILELQVLLTFNKLKEILLITLLTSLLSVLVMVCFASRYAELAAAYAVMIPHIIEIVLLYIAARCCMSFRIPYMRIFIYILSGLVLAGVYIAMRSLFDNVVSRVVISFTIAIVLYAMVLYLTKDSIFNLCRSKFCELVRRT